MDSDSFSGLSVALDDRKRPAFRPFWQVSARFGGNISALRSTHSGPLLPTSCRFLQHLFAQTGIHAPPRLRSPYFQAFWPQTATRARFMLVTTGCSSDTAFRVWWGCIWIIKHACNWSFSHAFLICTKHLKNARKNHGKTASRQSIAGPQTGRRRTPTKISKSW